MKVKPVDPNAVIRDPITKIALPAEGGDVPENNFWTRRWLDGEVWRREGDEWVRRLPNGELERITDKPAELPVSGNEPIRPLTTRGGK